MLLLMWGEIYKLTKINSLLPKQESTLKEKWFFYLKLKLTILFQIIRTPFLVL